MPGKRYNYRITAGALQGQRARIISLDQTNALIEAILQPGQVLIPQDWLKRIPNKTPKVLSKAEGPRRAPRRNRARK